VGVRAGSVRCTLLGPTSAKQLDWRQTCEMVI
jgi:hypothetical protein